MKIRQHGEPGAKLVPDDPFYTLIEEAYRVFATHKPSDTQVCVDCCMPRAMAEDFFVSEIRDLPLRYLEEWYSAAAATSGVSKHLWTYLLPRILEVLAFGTVPTALGCEVVLQRYQMGSEDEWSREQWQVLDPFQRRYLARKMSPQSNKGFECLDDSVCMFRLGGWNLDDLLAQVIAAPIEQLAERLWQDWCGDAGEYGTPWITTFWTPEDEARMKAFYTGDGLHEQFLDLALSNDHSPQLAQKASDLVSVIEREATTQ